MSIYSPNELFEALKNIIDLPNEVIELKIHILTGNIPTVEIIRYANDKDDISGIFSTGPITIHEKFKIVNPWEAPNDHGEYPGGICCQRATGEFCYEHDKNNYQ